MLTFDYAIAQDNIESQIPDLIPYRKGEKWGYCNKDKKIIIDIKYDEVELFNEELAMVKLNKKFGFIEKTGTNEGLAIVISNKKIGIIDKYGKEVIPIKYDNFWDFSKGLAKISKGDKEGYIDKNGTEYWED